MLWLFFLAVFHTVFLRSDATATIYFAAGFVQLLFEGGINFFGKARRHQRRLDKACTSATVTVARHCQ